MATPADTHTRRPRPAALDRAEHDAEHRVELVAGLRELADWLLNHPQVRVPTAS